MNNTLNFLIKTSSSNKITDRTILYRSNEMGTKVATNVSKPNAVLFFEKIPVAKQRYTSEISVIIQNV